MADLATLGVVVTTKGVKEAERELNGLGKAGETAEKGVKRVGPSIDNAAKAAKRGAADIERSAKQIGVAIGAATAALATGVAVAVKSAIDRADELSKAAQKIGITTEALSRLEFAAQLSDVSLQQLQQAVTFFGRSLDQNEPLIKGLGVSVRDASGNFRQADGIIRDLADVFASLPEGIQKSRLATELFGARIGADLLPLLNQGSAAIAELEAEADRLGLTVSTQTGIAAEQFNDNLTRLKQNVSGLALEVANVLLPDLVRLTDEFNRGADEGRDFKAVGGEIAAVIATIAETAFRAYKQLELFINGVTELSARAAQLVAANPLSGVGVADRLFFDGKIQREAGILAESSARRAADAARQADEGLGLGRGQFTDPVKEAAEAAKKAEERAAAEGRLTEEIRRQEEAQGKNTAARKAAAAAARAQAEAERELARIRDQGDASAAQLTASIQKGAAELAGPAAQAARQYADELLELTLIQERLAAAGLLVADTERELAIAREQSAERYQRALKRIEDENPAKRILADLEFELELLGKTNLEREKAIALRIANTDAASAEGQAIVAALDEIDRRGREIAALDEFRANFEDTVASVLDGSKSIKDAFKDFADAIIAQLARIVAQNLTAQLFGNFGQQGGGSGGNFLSGLFGAFFGGGRAVGGPVRPGQIYPVAEKGQPEILSMYGRKYLIPGGEGEVMPLREGSGGGSTVVNQTIQVTGTVDGRSAYQIQREAKMRLDMVGGR